MKIAVYTCIVGDKDVLRPCAPAPDCFDFICFAANGEMPRIAASASVWQIRNFEADCNSRVLLSRYPKMHPEELLPDYDYSLWIDGNVVISGPAFYESVLLAIEKGASYAGIRHPLRDCAFDEIKTCLRVGRVDFKGARAALEVLESEGLAKHAGLMENNVILRNHHDSKVAEFDALWWKTVSTVVTRDQFFHTLCLLKAGVVPDFLIPAGESVRDNSSFEYYPHPRTSRKAERYATLIMGYIKSLFL